MEDKEREYNRIKNKINHRLSRFTPESVLDACMQYLHKPDMLESEKLRYIQPWWLLLLIKWAILESAGNNHKRRPLGKKEFRDLLNLQKDLETARPTSPLNNKNAFLFLRQLAMQQFWMQERGGNWFSRFARQSLLFGALEKNSKLYLTFESQIKVSIKDFIPLMLITTAIANERQPVGKYALNADLLSSLTKIFGDRVTQNFFEAISGDIPTLRKYIRDKEGDRYSNFPLGSEFYEESPLLRYPLLRVNQRLFSYSPDLLFRSGETFIYDVLRAYNPQEFMQKFGKIFENYVRTVLKSTKIQFLEEDEILKSLSEDAKCVDFIIFEDDSAILIDAKGVELSFSARVAQYPDEVIKATKDSVMKGIRQAYSVVKNLKDDLNSNKSYYKIKSCI